ncbi:hypothetical protein GCM10010317_091510 [Streptomyces mirabilis]|nr:hypothetical protein GCM10010317_091510 [Streptomyces mirabilis]
MLKHVEEPALGCRGLAEGLLVLQVHGRAADDREPHLSWISWTALDGLYNLEAVVHGSVPLLNAFGRSART